MDQRTPLYLLPRSAIPMTYMQEISTLLLYRVIYFRSLHSNNKLEVTLPDVER
jgi:hypothetical protein